MTSFRQGHAAVMGRPERAAEPSNAAWMLRRHAQRQPERPALIFSERRVSGGERWHVRTYREMDEASDRHAFYLRDAGIKAGTRVILMVKPGPALNAILFALFKVGAVPVVVDPGMGIRRLLHCFESTGAEAFIGISVAYLVRLMARKTFSAVTTTLVVVGERLLGGVAGGRGGRGPFPLEPVHPDGLAMIAFTTGSTGPAKGVEYTQATLVAMAGMLGGRFGTGPGTVELVTVPLFGILDLMLGATAVLPRMNPTKPARVNPENIIGPANRFGATCMFASPALLNRVAAHGAGRKGALPSLRFVTSGGAPVSMAILSAFRPLLSEGARLFITWGATEGLPLSLMDSAEVFRETSVRTAEGHGNCIGRPFDGVSVKVIPIRDGAATDLAREPLCGPNEVGELIVTGANVSRSYHRAEAHNRALKIRDGAGGVWHRTGDLGFLDDSGRIWFCGRMAHRVQPGHGKLPLFSVRCEGVTNAHPGVYRSALVGIPDGRGGAEPVMCVELNARGKKEPRSVILAEVKALLTGCEATQGIRRVAIHPAFPVDIRHNAKINREALALWLTTQRGENMTHVMKKGELNPSMIVPVFGWLYIGWGLLFPFENAVLKGLWWVDLFLSGGVHALQLFITVPLAQKLNIPRLKAFACTMAFGATWWHPMRKQLKEEAS